MKLDAPSRSNKAMPRLPRVTRTIRASEPLQQVPGPLSHRALVVDDDARELLELGFVGVAAVTPVNGEAGTAGRR